MTDNNGQADSLAIILEAAKGFDWESKVTDEFDDWLSDGTYDLNFFKDAEHDRVVALYPTGAANSKFPQKALAAVEFKDGAWQPDFWTAIKEARRNLVASIAATHAKLDEFDALAAKHDAVWVMASKLTEAGVPIRRAFDIAFGAKGEAFMDACSDPFSVEPRNTEKACARDREARLRSSLLIDKVMAKAAIRATEGS